MESRRIVIILGRERDIEGSKFGLQFSLGGLVDEGKGSSVLAVLFELAVTDALVSLDEGVPPGSDDLGFDWLRCCGRHKV